MILRDVVDVGALIRDQRLRAGLDQQTLANMIGVGRLWISQVERGKPGASLQRILATLTALGLELDAKAREDDAHAPFDAVLSRTGPNE